MWVLEIWIWFCPGFTVCLQLLDLYKTQLSVVKAMDDIFQVVDAVHREGMSISRDIVYSLLQGCSKERNMSASRGIHVLMSSSGLNSVVVLGDHLIRLFTSCGSLLEANLVFCKVAKPTVHTWQAIISAHMLLGQSERALELYDMMQSEGVKPNKFIFLCILKACSNQEGLAQGHLIHEHIIRSGLISDLALGNTLLHMYAKCGSLDEARLVFDNLKERDKVSWCAMIAAYAQDEYGFPALELFGKMQKEGVKPDRVTFSCTLKACGSIGAIGQGKLIHGQLIDSELESDMMIGSTLMEMYAKCGNLEEAQKVFDHLPNRDIVTWSVMIVGYSLHGHGGAALKLFERMQQEGIEPNKVTFLCILKACTSIQDINQGRHIHDQIIKIGLEMDLALANTLLDMYIKCGCLEAAWTLFSRLVDQDVVSWGVMIAGCALHENSLCALELFEKMQHERIKPDKFTYSCILKACGCMGAVVEGELIHELIIRSGFQSDVVVGSSIVDMYAKCGNLMEARRVFDSFPNRNIMSWGAMIAGYAQYGQGFAALQLFDNMQQEGLEPNKATLLCTLKACVSIGALDQGKLIHDQVIHSGIWSAAIGNTLVDMYAKCGSLGEAHKVFDELRDRDVVSWGALITGYAQHGNFRLAKQCFENMQREGVKPNDTIYTSLLTACSHVGEVEEGRHFFKSMREAHDIMPNIEHLNCMVDLLGRAGHLLEAVKFLQSMHILGDITGWTSLLASCRIYGNLDLGRQCFDQVVQLDSNFAPAYVLMSSIYADTHMWEAVSTLQQLRKCVSAGKKPGKAWLEAKRESYEFIVGENAHPHIEQINVKLKRLRRWMSKEGYYPALDLVLELVPDEDKENTLLDACEEVSLANGLSGSFKGGI